MRQPKLNDLSVDAAVTRKFGSRLIKTKKITIHTDEQSLTFSRKVPSIGSSISAIAHQVFRDGTTSTGETKAWLEQIARESQKQAQIAA